MSTVIINDSKKKPGCLVQGLWFLFVGWWAGQVWIVVAWILMLTVIGIPLAISMMNKLPKVIAQRGPSEGLTVTTIDNVTIVSQGTSVKQRNVIIRALYFLLIGWWFSGIWMEVAYVLCLTIIGMPAGFWMFDRVPTLVSLHRD